MTAPLWARLTTRHPGYPYSLGRTLAIYVGLMVAVLLAALDSTIVATALPSIVSSLGGLSSYPWMLSAFLVCQTITVPLYGRLSDVYGRRTLFFVSIPIFLAGSALCGAAQSMTELIVFRGIQGVGAGGVIPLAMATTAEVVPPRDRGRYQGVISAGFAGASVLGPTVGGLIVDHASWRWIFYVNLPVGLMALAVIGRTMPRITRPSRVPHVDYRGAVLLGGSTALLLLGLLWGGQTFPWLSVEVIGAYLLAVVGGWMFVRRTRRVAEPLLPLHVVGDRVVASGAIATGLFVVGQMGATTFVPLFAQGVLGDSAVSSGIILIPQTLGTVVAAILAGQWVSHTGRYRGNALLGPIFVCLGLLQLSFMTVHTSSAQIVVAMITLGIGAGSIGQTLLLAAQSAVPLPSLGAATSIIQFSRAIGATVGVTIFGVIVNLGLPRYLRGEGTAVRRLPLPGRRALAAALDPAFLVGAMLSAIVLIVIFAALEERPLRASVSERPIG